MNDTSTNDEVRWRCRFRNFSRAYTLLSEAAERPIAELNQLEQEGTIQRFQYTFQLAWLTLKDRLEYAGIVLTEITPRNVIREAYAAGLISDGEVWIDLLTDRNLMAHTYDFARFVAVIGNIQARYLAAFTELYQRLGAEILE